MTLNIDRVSITFTAEIKQHVGQLTEIKQHVGQLTVEESVLIHALGMMNISNRKVEPYFMCYLPSLVI
jgi:hypothetical protein